MPKKVKEKAAGPPASGGPAKKPSKAPAAAPAEGDFIVFTDPNKESRGKKGGPSGASRPGPAATEGVPDGPPRPTVKQIIGGASWTGKLPVNLLSEHCQKQKWERPDYDTVRPPSYE